MRPNVNISQHILIILFMDNGYLLGLLIFDRVGWLYQYIINTVLDEERKPHYHHFRIKGKFSERSK